MRLSRAAICAGTLLMLCAAAHGQEWPALHEPAAEPAGTAAAPLGRDDELRQLYLRLAAAEQRIDELEADEVSTTLPADPRVSAREISDDGADVADETVADLIARFGKLEEEFEKLQAPEPAQYPTMEIGGRIHLDTWNFSDASPGIGFFENPGTGIDPEDRVFFRRIRLEIDGEVSETMLYRMQIDFNSPDTPEMKDVYLGFDQLPGNQRLQIGNQKRPLGLDHLNSSRFNVFIERPLVVEAFNEDARRMGAQVLGHTDDEVYNWQYGVYMLENVFQDGEVIGDSLQGSLNARLASTPWYDESSGGRGFFHWAISGMVAHPDGDVSPLDTNANEGRFRTRSEIRSNLRWLDTGRIPGAQWYEIIGLESLLNVGPFHVVAEYQNSWMQRDSDTPGTGPNLFFHGGYVYVAYFLTGESMAFNRRVGQLARVEPFENFFLVERCCGGTGTGWGAWQVALRLSYLDLTDNDIQGGREQNLTVGLNWHWTAYSKLQFNAVIGDIDQHEPVGGFTEGDFVALGTRFQIDF